MQINHLIARITSRAAASADRFILGIAGPPGAGKSTLANVLVSRINQLAGSSIAVLLPMDGFHEYDARLHQLGLYAEKGTPRTFRSAAFVQKLAEIRSAKVRTVFAPEYNRELHDPTEDAIAITPTHRVVIVEGNYLLLDNPQWSPVRSLLDESWFLDASDDFLRPRLLDRHTKGGKGLDWVSEKLASTDLPNAALVRTSASRANLILAASQIESLPNITKQSTLELLGIGASTLDILVSIPEFPAGRETMEANALLLQGGGPVATAIATAARLGVSTGMIDVLHDDWVSDRIRNDFARFDVDLRWCNSAAGSAPVSVIASKSISGERAIMYHRGSNRELDGTDADAIDLQGVRYIHMNGRHPRACQRLVERAKEVGCKISFDGGAQRFSNTHAELAEQSDVCIVARDFAERWTGKTDILFMLAAMQERVHGIVGITSGSHGSWIAGPDCEPFHQPAFLTPQTIDTTGCGDSYHGAFLASLIQGKTLQQSATIASAVAAINSTSLGGRGHLPDQAEVNDFLKRLTRITA